MTETLDAIDAKILSIIQDDAALPVAEVAEKVGLSSSPCWRRTTMRRPGADLTA